MIAKLKKYFSGKLLIVQISAGVGAFALRSVAAYSTSSLDTWITVTVTQVGSFTGYIASYFLGYWYVFRKDYSKLDRSMGRDVLKLQLVEQAPNVWTVISSAATQAALMENTDVGSDEFTAVFSANIASWFGPHKILNLAAMLASNSLKKAWVDHTWKPFARTRGWAGRFLRRGEA